MITSSVQHENRDPTLEEMDSIEGSTMTDSVTLRMCWFTEVPSFVHWTSDQNCDIYSAFKSKCFVSAPFMNNTHTHISCTLHWIAADKKLTTQYSSQIHSSAPKPSKLPCCLRLLVTFKGSILTYKEPHRRLHWNVKWTTWLL